MSNYTKVSVINSIVTLYDKGWPKLRIARELGVDVKTVRRYILLDVSWVLWTEHSLRVVVYDLVLR